MKAEGQVVHCVAYRDGHRVRDITIEDISEALKEDGVFVWLGLHEPNEPLMKKVQQEFGLHDLAVEDAHRAHQRPKLETYGDSLFVALHTAQMIDSEVHFGETHLFVGPRYVVTVRHGASLSYAPLRTQCEAKPDRLSAGPGYVLYALMDFVVDNYFPIIEDLEDQLSDLEDRIFKGAYKRRTTEELYALKRQIMRLRRAVVPLGEACNHLVRLEDGLMSEVIRPYFRDVHDHVMRISEATETMHEMLTTALHVNLSLLSIGQNDVVKKLAGWGAILAVPTLVASVYGMNFQNMPELHWRFGYPVMAGGTLTVCFLLHRKLRRSGWL